MNSLKLADRSTGLLLFSALLWSVGHYMFCMVIYILLYLSGSALEARSLSITGDRCIAAS